MNTALPSPPPPPPISFDKIVLVQRYTLCNVENSVKNQRQQEVPSCHYNSHKPSSSLPLGSPQNLHCRQAN